MSVDHNKNIIEIKNVSFGYTDEPVLKNISLNIHQGDYLGIIGPNGGGKTTLLKIILGLLQPQSGTIKIFGQDSNNFKDRFKFGYVPQKAINFDTKFPATVEEVVAMGRYAKRGLLRRLTPEDKRQVRKALQEVDMLEHKNRLIGDLSGGQQQRVFIARALASQPEIIFLDEPTAGVDNKTQEQFYALLKKLNETLNLTLILVSHDIDVIAHEVTEIAFVNQTLIYHGTPEKMLSGDYLQKLYGKNIKFILHDH